MKNCFFATVTACLLATVVSSQPVRAGSFVKGVNLLSADFSSDTLAISAAARDGLNHVQLSHRIVHDLCAVKDSATASLVNRLADFAHSSGIAEVCVWDHALYNTDYYPERFKVPGTGIINLDDPLFWEWMKQDYRKMIGLCPAVDGIVLTFIESGSRIEDNSSVMSVPQRLAKVINTVAEVICGEYGKSLWLRTFAYNEQEYANITQCFSLVNWDEKRMFLMVKDVPHDFFLYHPDNAFIGKLGHPTLVEFDACGEYNGQSVIMNALPDYFCERWKRYAAMPEVVGYVARTSRCGDDEITRTPSEINLFALRRASEDPSIDAERIYDEFITARYGKRALRFLKPAFKASRDILDGTMYPLKLNATHHSDLALDDQSTYSRHVSGRWTETDSVFLGHGVGETVHWWKDLVNTLSPVECKRLTPSRAKDVALVLEQGWLEEGNRMTEQYLDYIISWDRDCRRHAGKGFRMVKRARRVMSPEDYQQIYDIYERSIMCLDLRGAAHVCFWGARILERGEACRTRTLERKLHRAIRQTEKSRVLYQRYFKQYPKGTWDFLKDMETAEKYCSAAEGLL